MAIELEPTSYFHQVVYLTILSQARRYDEALRQMDRLADLNPGTAFGLYWGNAGALMTQENSPQAFARWMKYLKLSNEDEQSIRLYETIYQTAGWQGVMREQARKSNESPTQHMFLIAAINAQIGDKDKAMEFLEKSYQRREFWMVHLQVEPRLDSLRGDPRFNDLVKRVESR
jgi:tetratricopeptide (TPR) repeat protein